MSSKPTTPRWLQRLSDAEATKARAVLAKHGPDRAKRMLGLSDTRTLYKALAQERVHPLTANTVRAALSRHATKDTIP